MQGKTFLNKKCLYFDAFINEYALSIKKSIEMQGGEVDFFPFENLSLLARLKRKISRENSDNLKERYLFEILDSIGDKIYDYILIKHPVFAPHVFFERLKTIFPRIKIINYNWSSIQMYDYLDYMKYFDRVISFDMKDAARYPEIEYIPLFYADEFDELRHLDAENCFYKDIDIMFIGRVETIGRQSFLKNVEDFCNSKGLKIFFYLYYPFRGYFKDFVKGKRWTNVKFKFLSLKEIAEFYARAKVIIDSPMTIQEGLTMRTFETLGAGKKLITTNKNILSEPFFRDDYILVIDADNIQIDLDFVHNPFFEWNPEIENYSIHNWVKRVIC